MAYQVLARKWRPQVFEDLVAQNHITNTLKNAIKLNRVAQAYLFTGPRGVGKTTTARLLAKALNCINGPTETPCNECNSCLEINIGRSLDVLEIDGASNRGIDEIRDLREKVKYAPTQGKYKIYIVDEVHMLTTEAFNALLKTLEEPPPHVVFIFATTEPHKVPSTILSRCQRFDFRRIPLSEIITSLEEIAKAENVKITRDALFLIAKKSDGGMRDAQSMLDQISSLGENEITDEIVREILGLVDQDIFFQITEALKQKNPAETLNKLNDIITQGYDLYEFILGLLEHLRNLLLIKVGTITEDVSEMSSNYLDLYNKQSNYFAIEDLLRMINLTNATEIQLKRASYPRILLESLLIRLAKLDETVELTDLINRLESGDLKTINTPNTNTIQSNNPQPITSSIPSNVKQKISQPDTKPLVSIDGNLITLWQQIITEIKNNVGGTWSGIWEINLNKGQPIKLENDILTIAFPKVPDQPQEMKKFVETALLKLTNRKIQFVHIISDIKITNNTIPPNNNINNIPNIENSKSEIELNKNSDISNTSHNSNKSEEIEKSREEEILNREPIIKKIVDLFDTKILKIEVSESTQKEPLI